MTVYISHPTLWIAGQEKRPDVSFIPPMMRRKLSDIEKIALWVAEQTAPKGVYRSVFASRFGEWRQTLKLLRQFYTDKEVSPAGFSLSVHNAAAGLYSLLKQNPESYTALAANEDTFEMGFIEAYLSEKPVLYVYAEEEAPDLYQPLLKQPSIPIGIGLFLSKTPAQDKISLFFESSPQSMSMPAILSFLNGTQDELIGHTCRLKREEA